MIRRLPFLLLAVCAWAAEPFVDISASPAEVAVGDTVTVTLRWGWPKGWTPEHEPDPVRDFREAFVTEAPPVASQRTAEGEVRSVKLVLLANRSGAWALPRPVLQGSGTAGPASATAAAVVIQVGTEAKPPQLPAAAALRLRPPAPPVAAPPSPWWALAAVPPLLAIVWWWRRRRAQVAAVPPEVRFAEELSGLERESEGKALAAALGLALRRYAGALWGFDGAGATVRELAARAERITRHQDTFRTVVRLLRDLDDRRWAPGDLPSEGVRPLVAEARALVETLANAERAWVEAQKNAKNSVKTEVSP